MRLQSYLNEAATSMSKTGLGADGMSKDKLKSLIYKETKKCTYNQIYKDRYWQGIKCIWDIFDQLDLNWMLTKSKYNYDKMNPQMPSSKQWDFEILWDDDKGRHKKLMGYVIASGAGSVKDPLEKYDVILVVS